MKKRYPQGGYHNCQVVVLLMGTILKYETTYFDIEKEIKETEASLCSMIDDLVGDEYDMKGLSELKSLLSGE